MSATPEDIRADIRRRLSGPDALRASIRERLAAAEIAESPGEDVSPARRNPLEQEQLRRRIREDDELRSARGQAIRTGAGGFLAGILSIPHAAGELMVHGTALLEGAGAAMIPGGRGFEYGQRVEDTKRFLQTPVQRLHNPASMLLQMPDPDAQDVLAAAGTVRRLPGELIETPLSPIDAGRRAYAGARAEETIEAEEHPIASAVGQAGADIATLLTLRPRFREGYREMGEQIVNRLPQRMRRFFRGEVPKVEPSAAETANQAANVLVQGLRLAPRGAGRVAEAGFEGAVIAALGDGDPATTAMWSAGVQGGGSLLLFVKSNILSKYPLRTFASLVLGHEMFKALAPGDQNIVESGQQVTREMLGAYGLGMVAYLVGANRGSEAQRLVNAIATANRASVASVVTQLQDAEQRGQPEYNTVVETMIADPDYFGREARMRIERASRRESPSALLDEIDALFRSERFRRRFEEIPGQTAPPRE